MKLEIIKRVNLKDAQKQHTLNQWIEEKSQEKLENNLRQMKMKTS